MTKITVTYDESRKIKGIEASGHSGYAESGEDIVCSAVSVLMQTCLQSLEYIGGIDNLICDMNTPGEMKVQLPDNFPCGIKVFTAPVSKAEIIFETILIGLQGVEAAYPEYVEIKI